MKHIILNIRLLASEVLCALFAILAASALSPDGYNGIAITFLVLSAITGLASLVLFPHWVIMDEHGITVCYVFGLLRQTAAWDEITAIYRQRESRVYPLETYILKGLKSNKPYRFMNGEINKTRQTTKWLKKYWDGNVSELPPAYLKKK